MSSSATVRNVFVNPTKFSLGGLCGYGDHTVPEGATVVEAKQCEKCVAIFIREKRPLEARKVRNYGLSTGYHGAYAVDEPEYSTIYVDRGERYCKRCRGNLLMPLDLADYKEQLEPQLTVHHNGNKLPKYDDSLRPVERRKRRRVRLPGNVYESNAPAVKETVQ